MFFTLVMPVSNRFTWVGCLRFTFNFLMEHVKKHQKVSDLHHLQQGCTNYGRQVTLVTKVSTVAHNIRGSSVWNVLQ